MPGEAIPIFTVESLKTPEGLADLNRILQLFSDNVAGDTDTVKIYKGFGTPEGVIAAGIGSMYQRLDGGTGNSLYIKESGTDATGWVTGSIPSGLIATWSGAVSAIPSGWVICDGNNGTPDLTDKFVLHADADSGGTNNPGDTGGASTHTLLIAEIPSHNHDVIYDIGGGNPGRPVLVGDGSGPDDDITHPTETTGGGGAHSNRDKFYALAYIQKS